MLACYVLNLFEFEIFILTVIKLIFDNYGLTLCDYLIKFKKSPNLTDESFWI
jgi:hypothetical protein